MQLTAARLVIASQPARKWRSLGLPSAAPDLDPYLQAGK